MKPMTENDFRKVSAIFFRIATNRTDYQSIKNVAKTTNVPINRVYEVRNFLLQNKIMFTVGERSKQRLTWFNTSCPLDSTIESWYNKYVSSISVKNHALKSCAHATKTEKNLDIESVLEFLKNNGYSGEIKKTVVNKGINFTKIFSL